jgi:hypothetical protein
MASDVSVKFDADIGEFETGVAQAKTVIAEFHAPVDEARTSLVSLNQTMSDVSREGGESVASLSGELGKLADVVSKGGAAASTGWLKVLLGGAIGAAAGGILEYVHKTGQEMIELDRNAKEAGLSLEDFQKIKGAANLAGVSDDKFVAGLQQASKLLNDLGHGTTDLSKFLDANNVKYQQANGELISMNEYLQVAARLINNAHTEQDRFKWAEVLGFSRDWVRILEGGPAALQASMDRAQELGLVFDHELTERAKDFEKKWQESSTSWEHSMKSAAMAIVPYIEQVVNYVRDDLAREMENFTRWTSQMGSGAPAQAIKAAMAGTVSEAERLAESFAIVESESAKLPAYWMQVLSDLTKADALTKELAAGNYFPKDGTKGPPEKENLDAMRAEMEEMKGAIQQADIAFQQVEEETTSSVKTFGISETKKTELLVAALRVRTDAQLAAAAEELSNLNEKDAEYLAAVQRVINESLAIEAEAAAKLKKILDDQSQSQVRSWQSMLAPIQSAWDSQLRGLLAGTTTWAAAMKAMTADLVMAMIREFEKIIIVDQIAAGLQKAFGAAPDLSGMLKAIWASVAEVYAATAAYLAPSIGPFAVPAAAAVAATVGVGAAAFMNKAEVGAWNIPTTSPWLLHPGETVLPAGAAAAFRDAAEGRGASGGGGGPTVNVSLNYTGRTAMSEVREHAHIIAQVVREHMDRNPTTFSR